MYHQLDSCKISLGATIFQALEAIDLGCVEIALVLDSENRLVGILTDGDIRRALLKGATLHCAVDSIVQRNFTAVGPGVSRAEVIDLMQARTIAQIPVVNEKSCLIGLHLLHEVIGSIERSNWAIIMAGGRGSRLGNLTQNLPKPMIRVAGRPILERLVLHLVGFGIRKIFLAVNYLGHIVEQHFGDGSLYGCEISYLHEATPLGTGGALSLLPKKPKDPVLVLNGDLVTQADIGAMLEFHLSKQNEMTIGLREYSHTVPYGCVELRGSQIVQIQEKPVLTRLVNTGIYVIDPQVLTLVPREVEFPITNLIEELLKNQKRVGGFEITGDWIDVGQKTELKMAREGTFD